MKMLSLHALNLAALVALTCLKPRDARSLVERLGKAMPDRLDRSDAAEAVVRLKPLGTCLSRSLAIASRLPEAQVVIGVRKEGLLGDVRAHAWVEHLGRPLVASEVVGEELARL